MMVRSGAEWWIRGLVVAVVAVAAALGCEGRPGDDTDRATDASDPGPPVGVDVSGAPVEEIDSWPEVVDVEEGRTVYPSKPVDPENDRPPLAGVTDLLPRRGGGVYIANGDYHEILVVDGDGRIRWRAGGEGGGPGEFEALSGLQAWAGDTLVAVDDGADAASFWTDSGQPVRTVTAGPLMAPRGGDPLIVLPGHPLGVLDDGRVVARGPQRAFGTGEAGLRRTRTSVTLTGADRDTTVPFVLPGPWVYELRKPQRLPAVAAPMGGSTAVAVADGRAKVDLVWARADTFEVLLLDADGQARRIYRVDEPRDPVTADVRRRFRQEWSPWFDVKEDIPFPDQVPAFDRVFVASDGAVWARRYHYRWSGEGEEWLRFTRSDGMDRFRFPPGVEVMAARSDIAYAIRRGELGVERVVAFPLGD